MKVDRRYIVKTFSIDQDTLDLMNKAIKVKGFGSISAYLRSLIVRDSLSEVHTLPQIDDSTLQAQGNERAS